jgi:crotonobetainyl-CoA:carnitine CoA-transferase CaiB-like acyl-CoA transferase
MAESGYVGVNGGVLTPISLCDLAAGMVAVQDVLAALYERQESGVGAYCDVSMFDAFVWWNTLLSGRYDFNGGRLDMEDLEHPTVGYNIYKTKDGRTMAFALMEQKFWKPFCEEMRFGADMIAALRLHRHEAPEAFERMEKLVASRTMAEWKEWLGDRDMCIAPVKTPARQYPKLSHPYGSDGIPRSSRPGQDAADKNST